MPLETKFEIDLDGRDSWAHPGTDFSKFVLKDQGQALWSYGIMTKDMRVAPAAMANLMLSDKLEIFNQTDDDQLTDGEFNNWSGTTPADTLDDWTTVNDDGVSNYTQKQDSFGEIQCKFVTNGTVDLYIEEDVLTPGVEYYIETFGNVYVSGTLSFGDETNSSYIGTLSATGNPGDFVFTARGSKLRISALASSGATNITIQYVRLLYRYPFASLKKNTNVRISQRATSGDSWVVRWKGFLDNVQTRWKEHTEQPFISMVSQGPRKFIDRQLPELQLSQEITTDEALTLLLTEVFVPIPYKDKFIPLDGTARLLAGGSARQLYGPADFTDFDTGVHTIDWVGDTIQQDRGVSPAQYIEQVCLAEFGYFGWDGSDQVFKFLNRHHGPLSASSFTFTQDDIIDAKTSSMADMVNFVEAQYYPREYKDTAISLYSADNLPIKLAEEAERTFNAGFGREYEEAQVSLVGNANLEIIATDDEEGTGTRVEENLVITMSTTPNRATINITNLGPECWIQSFNVTGKALFIYQPKTVSASNPTSTSDHGIVPHPQNPILLHFVSQEVDALNFCEHMVTRYGEQLDRPYAITVNLTSLSDARRQQVLALTFGDVITITHTYKNHDGDYMITGVQTSSSTTLYTVTFYLEPRARYQYIILDGRAKLDGTWYIAP